MQQLVEGDLSPRLLQPWLKSAIAAAAKSY
jgi:hypothetical protein